MKKGLSIIDTSSKIDMAYVDKCFNLECWKIYIDEAYVGIKELCLNDLKEFGYDFNNDCLPVLNNVVKNEKKFNEIVQSFHKVTNNLEERIVKRFKRLVDVDIILYLGLCNGAGWVTEVKQQTVILLGIEKIIELDWVNKDDMNGLILHELGHVYQKQYGVLDKKFDNNKDKFLWQLFTEGIAMVFEQELVNDENYYHQDKDGWKSWCDLNIKRIIRDFYDDLDKMTYDNQRYFGDWVDYEGHIDVGYYLGTRLVRYILKDRKFDEILSIDNNSILRYFEEFMNLIINNK